MISLPEKGPKLQSKNKQSETYAPAEQEIVDDPDSSFLLRLRQLGDQGLRQAMQFLSKDE